MITPSTTIRELQKLLADKKITPAESISYYTDRIARYNKELNAVIESYAPDTTTPNGVLSGIPGLIKDNISCAGRITSGGSHILRNYRAPYDATVVARLKKSGADIIGRTNMDEFGFGSTGEYSCYGPTANPWNFAHSPGGSSSGSASAVAAGLAPWALGTETGGSVRLPASFCNLAGLYPTYGLLSRSGLLAFCSSSDQPGVLTRTVADNALILSQIAGHDAADSSSIQVEPRDYTTLITGKLPENFTIGVLSESLTSDGVHSEVKATFAQVIKAYEKKGARIEYITMPNLSHAIAVYFILTRAEAASNLSRYDGTLYGSRVGGNTTLSDMYTQTRHAGFGIEAKRRILMGNYVLSAGHRDAYYNQAQRVRSLIRAEYSAAFSRVDVLMSPTASTLPVLQGAANADPLAIYMADYFTVPNCIIGLPALSVPAGFSREGLPIGFQLIGPRLSEALLYQVGAAYEADYPFWQQLPEQFID